MDKEYEAILAAENRMFEEALKYALGYAVKTGREVEVSFNPSDSYDGGVIVRFLGERESK